MVWRSICLIFGLLLVVCAQHQSINSNGTGSKQSTTTTSKQTTITSQSTTQTHSGRAAAAAAGGPRMVAYINCLCGFGVKVDGKCKCLTETAGANYMANWEKAGDCPITHYIVSFLSFKGSEIQTDPGNVWKVPTGSTSDFTLHPNLAEAMTAAQANGKKIILSVGGQIGSGRYLQYWKSKGADTASRVKGMRADIAKVVALFQTQNKLTVTGIDVDIELGGGYAIGSDKYIATRDLINAIPDTLTAAFVPQVGNGLCVPPVIGDKLNPSQTLGGQCMENATLGQPFSLVGLDKDCLKADGTKKLDYFGIQYYNAGQAVCCGGTADSVVQNYKNLANGWPEVTAADMDKPDSPWHKYRWFPGPWKAFEGIGADRLVLGKPACHGCAGSDYVDLPSMLAMFGALKGHLKGTMGGVLYWDLCRIFGDSGTFCVGGQCQPSWGGTAASTKTNLQKIMDAMKNI